MDATPKVQLDSILPGVWHREVMPGRRLEGQRLPRSIEHPHDRLNAGAHDPERRFDRESCDVRGDELALPLPRSGRPGA